MLYSMTGYGKSTGVFEGKTVTVEIKTLNSKSLDLYVRIPPLYRERELSIRQLVSDRLERGKIDVIISIESSGNTKNIEINKDLVKVYLEDLKTVNELVKTPEADYLSLIMKMPDIFVQSNENTSDEELAFLDQLTIDACEKVIDFRAQEGRALDLDFKNRIGEIDRLLKAVEPFESARIETIRERMRKALEELDSNSVDENRFEQELIFYIEKIDISEEKMRLSNHLQYFLETMEAASPGKKLGFITQELGREINTLGSKSYHVEMQKIVVDMKDNLEKIKEQVLNTL